MTYIPPNVNGQAAMANSEPVVIASDQTPLPLAAVHFQDLFITGQGSQTALNQNVILAVAGTGSVDAQNGTAGISFRSVAIQITPAAGTVTAGVITFEGSNDNFVSTAVPVFLVDAANITAAPVTSVTLAAATTRYFRGTIPFRHFRARISTAITGTTTGVQAFTLLSSVPFADTRLTVSQPTGTSLNVAISSQVPGVAATNLGKAEDAVAASGDTGVFTLGVRRDGPITVAPVSAAGDYSEMAVDNFGQMRIAAQARTTNPAAAADGNGSVLMTDKLGKQVVVGSVRELKNRHRLTITSSVAETTIVAAVAATFRDIHLLVITNTSATTTNVTIRDGTAGAIVFVIQLAAGEKWGFVLTESAALPQTAVNTNWTAQCSVSVASVEITAITVNNI